MFSQGRVSFRKVLGYYILLLLLLVVVWLMAYQDLNVFVKSELVKNSLFILAVIGLLYVTSISKIKDVLIIQMFNTKKYDDIYNQAKMSSSKINNDLYINKYSPLNHLVDMVRSCGWTMILCYPLILLFNHYESSILTNVLVLIFLSVSMLSGLISTYFIYKNFKVLRNFKK